MNETKVFFPIGVGKIRVMGYQLRISRFKSKDDLGKFVKKFVKNNKSGVLVDVFQRDDGVLELLHIDSLLNYNKVEEVNRVFEVFSNLGISEDLSNELSDEDKDKIVGFLGKYSMLRDSQIQYVSETNLLRSSRELGDLFCLFIPFLRKTDPNTTDFFREFQREYVAFRDAVHAVNKRDIIDLKGLFDLHLANISPAVQFQANSDDTLLITVPHWNSRTLLDWCYFELYQSLLKKEKSKSCKYCGEIFFSDKENRLCCDYCRRSKSQYKKGWYQKHKTREQRKAKERMRKRRKKQKKEVLKS